MSNTSLRAALLVSTTLAIAGLTTAALAQNAPPPPPKANANALEEVVVTATRQNSTVNKVALSVSAVTQKSLDQQGIRNVADLSSQVPGFTFRTSGGDNNPNLTLRGIGGNALNGTSGAAPTTGVYIDDQPLQKRNANGLVTGSGSPLPLLYDLDRIEVLRGPQGTLYGGSSEGGTLRFILPQPSLTTYSGTMRVGVSTMAGGGNGDEEGIAIGGPIVQDKLGFRVSGFRQDRPGWVDNFSQYDGHQFASNVNWGADYSLRGAVLWQVTPDFKATVSLFQQMNYDNDTPNVTTSSPAMTFPQVAYKESGTVNGVQFSFPSALLGPPGGFTTPATTWLGNGNGTTNGRYLSATNVQYVASPRRTILTTPSLVLDYNWHDKLAFKSITSYVDDTTGGDQFTGGGAGVRSLPTVSPQAITKQGVLYPSACPSGAGLVAPILTATCNLSPRYLPLSNVPGGVGGTFTPGPADVFGNFFYNNRRGQTTQEFRVSTLDPSWKLQFVVGAFIEHENNHVNVGSSWNETQITQQALGVPEVWFQGQLPAPVQQKPGALPIDVSTRNIDITEDEQAIFGELNYNITSKLKVTAGVRVTNYTQQFYQQYGGTVSSAPSGFYGVADDGSMPTLNADGSLKAATTGIDTNPNSTGAFTTNYGACPKSLASAATVAAQLAYAKAGCPYQYTATKLTEKPITPKFGVSYQLTPNDLIYATYAEGYRPGGINPFVPPIMCAADLATLGLTQSPAQYTRDSVKSTEVGGKFRLFDGQAQINAAAFHIEWDNVQFVLSLPLCAFSYVANAATAASDGGELQFQGRTHGFTLNGNVGYDDARYTQTAMGPVRSDGKPRTILVNKGDNLGVPDWTANAGVQYDWQTFVFPTYARIDAAYTGKYMRVTSVGTAAYNAALSPNFINGQPTTTVNARVGIYYKDLEIAGYVKNMFNAQQWINLGEGSGTYAFNGNKQTPRLIGMQMNYRF
jgi:outer membrane receptor protein involved in Fe transport